MQVFDLGRRPHAETDAAMRDFTATRDVDTPDQLWLVEHDPVFTLGVAARAVHVRAPGDIPVVATDRGGQVTYHGPGQVVAYPLVDLARLRLHVREYVFRVEEAVLETLGAFAVTGHRVRGAPGVYVRPDDPGSHARLAAGAVVGGPGDVGAGKTGGETPPAIDPFAGLAKVAALGVKVSRHRTRHGVALNVAMDLAPFGRIDPCGHAGLRTTDLRSLGVDVSWHDAAAVLAAALARRLAPG